MRKGVEDMNPILLGKARALAAKVAEERRADKFSRVMFTGRVLELDGEIVEETTGLGRVLCRAGKLLEGEMEVMACREIVLLDEKDRTDAQRLAADIRATDRINRESRKRGSRVRRIE